MRPSIENTRSELVEVAGNGQLAIQNLREIWKLYYQIYFVITAQIVMQQNIFEKVGI